MRKIFLLSFLFLLISNYSVSQNSKKANKLIKQAQQSSVNNDIDKSKEYLQKAVKVDTLSYEAYALLGNIHFGLEEYSLAIYSFKKSYSISPENYLKYKLGNSYFLNEDYGKAKVEYKKYLSKVKPNNKQIKEVKKKIINCEFSMEAMKNPVEFNPINIGIGVNTPKYEYNPVVTADGNSMIYTVIRTKKGRNIEDFYISELKNNRWQTGVPLPGKINTDENEGAHCISMDGKFLFFTSCGRTIGLGSCDIYVSINHEGKWTKPVNLGRGVNTKTWDAHPALSPDGKTLIFSSTREGGKGGKDLWISEYKNGGWANARNMTELNTKGDEVTPFFHVDGKTLYFSSNGHAGMGGTDFFISHYDYGSSRWSEPVNLGYKINTHKDEYSLMVARDGKTAYYASDALDGYGGMDIYTFELTEGFRASRTAYLQGSILDKVDKSKIDKAEVLIVDLKTTRKVESVRVENGTYKALLPSGRIYAAMVKADNYLLYSETFEFSASKDEDYVKKDFKLQRLLKGKSINLNNVNFESGSSKLLKESYFELNMLVDYLKNNKKYRIKVIGHTDNIGTVSDNYKLSIARAKSVKNYLVKKGIIAAKLKYYGKGETKPLTSNKTEKGRKKNRRTEIVLY